MASVTRIFLPPVSPLPGYRWKGAIAVECGFVVNAPRPQRPENLDPLAAKMLDEIKQSPEAKYLVIGGGVALNCFLRPRLTHDVDAWWTQGTVPPQRDAAVARIRTAAQRVANGAGLTVSERTLSTNDVISIALVHDAKTMFSFQVAPRTIELQAPHGDDSPFFPLALESLMDNLGSKMSALVSRGAPRDFLDVRAAVDQGAATVSELWELWLRKNPGQDVAIAKSQVVQHLAGIEMRRPLAALDNAERAAAIEVRAWIRGTLAVETPDS